MSASIEIHDPARLHPVMDLVARQNSDPSRRAVATRLRRLAVMLGVAFAGVRLRSTGLRAGTRPGSAR
jgi:hypothetical protein